MGNSEKTLTFKERFEEIEQPERWQIGRESGDVMETWEEESFQDEAVTTV